MYICPRIRGGGVLIRCQLSFCYQGGLSDSIVILGENKSVAELRANLSILITFLIVLQLNHSHLLGCARFGEFCANSCMPWLFLS